MRVRGCEDDSYIKIRITLTLTLNVTKNGFPYGDDNILGHKDYLHLK